MKFSEINENNKNQTNKPTSMNIDIPDQTKNEFLNDLLKPNMESCASAISITHHNFASKS